MTILNLLKKPALACTLLAISPACNDLAAKSSKEAATSGQDAPAETGAPKLTAAAFDKPEYHVGEDVTFTVTAQDHDGAGAKEVDNIIVESRDDNIILTAKLVAQTAEGQFQYRIASPHRAGDYALTTLFVFDKDYNRSEYASDGKHYCKVTYLPQPDSQGNTEGCETTQVPVARVKIIP